METAGQATSSGEQPVQKPPNRKPQTQLFDLEADLGEKVNLADGHPGIVARLRERMLELDREITANARPQWSL